MKLSDLVARCDGHDPELMVEDEYGIPHPVTDIDVGVMSTTAGPVSYVLLEPAQGDED